MPARTRKGPRTETGPRGCCSVHSGAGRGQRLPYLVHVELLDLVDQVLQRRLGESAGLREDDDAVADGHDRRDRADVELRGERLLGLGVDLAEGDLGVLLRGPLVGGREADTRTAP